MKFVETSNENLAHLIGQEVKTSHVCGEEKLFSSEDGTKWKSTVKRIYRTGDDVVFVTEHSTYGFRLNVGERLVMGVTV